MSQWKRFSSKGWLVMPLLALVFLAVACGAAATATPAPAATKAPAAPPTLVEGAAPTPAPTVAAAPKAAPTPTPGPVPAAKVHPGKLTIMVGDLSTERFDVLWATGAGSRHYHRIVHGFLISDNERRELVPGIASQWGLSADGLTWTFTVRKGVKFHDGSDLTPRDVLWSFQYYFGPESLEYSTASYALLVARLTKEIKFTEPDKVSLTTKQPNPEFADLVSEVSNSTGLSVIPKRAKVHDREVEAAYDNNPIGAGFMRLVKHVPAYVMSFERFDDFYYQPKNGFPEDKRANFKSLDMFLVPEEASRVAAIRAGQADIAPVSLAVKKQVEAGGGRLVFVQEGNTIEVMWVGCHKPEYRCQDKRVRQALDFAIDKELIRNTLYGPEVFYVKGWAVATPSTIGYTPALAPRPFDPNKARQLLADAGYPGGKGFGKLIMVTPPSSPMPYTVEGALLVADLWKRELGLDVKVTVVDTTGINQRRDAGDLNDQLYWYPNETRTDPTGFIDKRYGSPNHSQRLHSDPELFRLVQETVSILDPDKRSEASKKLFPRLREEAYQLTVGYANTPWAVGTRVLTWVPYPLVAHPSALHTITLK